MRRNAEAHVLVFPFPTQGHLNPALDLASSLAQAGLRVTVVHTPGNLDRLARLQQPHHCNTVHAVALPLSPDDAAKLPAAAPLIHIFQTVDDTTLMSRALESLIRAIDADTDQPRISYLICDSFLPWTMDVASKFGIPRSELWTSTASGYLIGYHLPEVIRRGYLPFGPGATENVALDFLPGISDYEEEFRLTDLPSDLILNDSTHPLFQFLYRAFRRGREASRVLVNTFEELEGGGVIQAMRAEGVRVTPIGPLGRGTGQGVGGRPSLLAEDASCLEWLDEREAASVLYVSFGSASRFSEEDVRELAMGLEASGLPFLWALGPWAVGTDHYVLTCERGLVVPWAPQARVLAHPAVGGFLSHCGWNSVLESLWAGVPILGCPRVAEQNTNLWFVRKWKVGLPLNPVISRGAVEAAVKALLHGADGAAARTRALEVREQARSAVAVGGPSVTALAEVVHEIRQQAIPAWY